MTPWLRFPSPCCHNPVIASISTIDTSAYHPRSWSYASANPSPNPFLTDVDLLLVEFQNQNMKVNFLSVRVLEFGDPKLTRKICPVLYMVKKIMDLLGVYGGSRGIEPIGFWVLQYSHDTLPFCTNFLHSGLFF